MGAQDKGARPSSLGSSFVTGAQNGSVGVKREESKRHVARGRSNDVKTRRALPHCASGGLYL